MVRGADAEWFREGAAIAEMVRGLGEGARNAVYAAEARKRGVRRGEIGRWVRAAEYVRSDRRRAAASARIRASVRSIERLREIESLDFDLARELGGAVVSGEVGGAALRVHQAAAERSISEGAGGPGADDPSSLVRHALGRTAPWLAPDREDRRAIAVWGRASLSHIGDRIGLDGEAVDPLHGGGPGGFHAAAAVLSPLVAGARNAGAPFERVLDVLLMAAAVYDRAVLVAVNDAEGAAVAALRSRAPRSLEGLESVRAPERGWNVVRLPVRRSPDDGHLADGP